MFYYFHTHNRMYASQQILCETHTKTSCVCGDRNGPSTYQAELLTHMNNVLNISMARMLYGTYLQQKCCLSETQK